VATGSLLASQMAMQVRLVSKLHPPRVRPPEVGAEKLAPDDDGLAEHVYDEGDLRPTLRGRDKDEVRYPQPVPPLGLELPIDPNSGHSALLSLSCRSICLISDPACFGRRPLRGTGCCAARRADVKRTSSRPFRAAIPGAIRSGRLCRQFVRQRPCPVPKARAPLFPSRCARTRAHLTNWQACKSRSYALLVARPPDRHLGHPPSPMPGRRIAGYCRA
jgi:hypothetical protein